MKNLKVTLLRNSEVVYLIGFSVYIITLILTYTTTFNIYIDDKLVRNIKLVSILLVLLKIYLLDRFKIKEIIVISLLLTLSMLYYIKFDDKIFIYQTILLIGARNISFRKMLRLHFYLVLISVLLGFIGVAIGIIPNVLNIRGDISRYSFGSVYPTDFGARIFYLLVTLFYLKYKKMSLKYSVCFFIIAIFIYKFCDARNDVASIMLLTFISIVIARKQDIKKIFNIYKSKIIKFIFIYSVPISAISSITLTILYNPKSKIFVFLNKLFSERLSIGRKAIDIYGIKLLGNKIVMHGWGGVHVNVKKYFFIDSSYLSILLQKGLILLVIICIGYVIYNKKKVNERDWILPIVIFCIAMNSIMEHHFIDILYNPFLLIFFTRDDGKLI